MANRERIKPYALLILGHNHSHESTRCEACHKPGGVAFARPVTIPYATRTFWTLLWLCPDCFEEAARKAGKLPPMEEKAGSADVHAD